MCKSLRSGLNYIQGELSKMFLITNMKRFMVWINLYNNRKSATTTLEKMKSEEVFQYLPEDVKLRLLFPKERFEMSLKIIKI